MISPINKTKWYSLTQLVQLGQAGYLPIRSKYKFMQLIEIGELKFINPCAKKFLGNDLLKYFDKAKEKYKAHAKEKNKKPNVTKSSLLS